MTPPAPLPLTPVLCLHLSSITTRSARPLRATTVSCSGCGAPSASFLFFCGAGEGHHLGWDRGLPSIPVPGSAPAAYGAPPSKMSALFSLASPAGFALEPLETSSSAR